LVDEIFADPCVGGELGEQVEVGPTVDDLAQALLEQPFTVATELDDVMLGGFPARRIDVTAPDDVDLSACNIPDSLQIWRTASNDYLVASSEATASLYIVDVDGDRQVFFTQQRDETTPSELSEMQTIVESIRFGQ
jgi:hypothetical protein